MSCYLTCLLPHLALLYLILLRLRSRIGYRKLQTGPTLANLYRAILLALRNGDGNTSMRPNIGLRRNRDSIYHLTERTYPMKRCSAVLSSAVKLCRQTRMYVHHSSTYSVAQLNGRLHRCYYLLLNHPSIHLRHLTHTHPSRPLPLTSRRLA